MNGKALFERILPPAITGDSVQYNALVVGLSLVGGLVSFGIFVLLAILASYRVSTRLKAGMAGMSILILFVFASGVLALVVLILLLATNLR